MSTDLLSTEALAQLTDDGDTYKLEDGRTLRLRIQPDEYMSIDDDEFLGQFAWVDSRDRQRPAGFDGNAEKLWASRSDQVWWQPPTDVKRDSEHFAALRREVRDTLEMGYSIFTLELLDGTDGYGRPIVTHVESLGGISPNSDVDEIVSELLDQLLDEISS